MNNEDIKKLAELSFANGKVNESVKNFVLNNLSIRELRTYVFHLKNQFKKNKVYVTISNEPTKSTVGKISEIFEDKEIEFKVDPSLGGGIRIENDDNIINVNFKSLITQAVEKLKGDL